MEKNKKSVQKSKIPGIIMIVAGILFLVLGAIIYTAKSGSFGIDVGDIAGSTVCLAIGVVMLFVKVKGYGWLITATVFAGVIISKFAEGMFDGSFYFSIVITVVCLGMLVFSNLKKQK